MDDSVSTGRVLGQYGLVRGAYERARVEGDQDLVAWNARVYLDESLVVMESACPIFLDKIIEQLRIFVGSQEARLNQFLWVRTGGNRSRRWASARPRSGTAQTADRAGEVR